MVKICRIKPRTMNCKKKKGFLVGSTGLVND